MPSVVHPKALKAVYEETLRRIGHGELPTELIDRSRTLYRSAEVGRFLILPNGTVDKNTANEFLKVRDQFDDRNRFTGISKNADIPGIGGLYCSLEQSALLNEMLHYADPRIQRDRTGFADVNQTLAARSIVRIQMMSSVLVADLSPRNPGARQFISTLGKSNSVQQALHKSGTLGALIWEQLFDGEDCSVARGIGLAVAKSGFYAGLKAFTVRPSPRSDGPKGENIVFFGRNKASIQGLWIDEAYLYPANAPRQTYPVVFQGHV